MEEFSVSRNLDTFKRQKHLLKDKVDGVEMLEDPILYDLKVSHNGRQRAQSHKAKAAKNELLKEMQEFKKNPPAANDLMRKQRFEDLKRRLQSDSGSEAVREIRETLATNLQRHVKRLDIRRITNAVWNKKEKEALFRELEILVQITDGDKTRKSQKEFMKAHLSGLFSSVTGTMTGTSNAETSNLRRESSLEDDNVSNSDALSDKPTPSFQLPSPALQRNPKKEQAREPTTVLPSPSPLVASSDTAPKRATSKRGSLQGTARPTFTDAEGIALAELLGFLVGCCGTVEAAFSDLDSNKDGHISAEEWECGLQRLGFKDEVCVFRMMGKGQQEGVSLRELQALFTPCLESLRSMPRRSIDG
jgi:hypothetical protein